jgi:hypothetical protein
LISERDVTHFGIAASFGQQAATATNTGGRWWHAPVSGKRGGQPLYSDVAIETGLALRLVFHQPPRQIEGAMRSIVALLGIDLAIPDHTTFSRRGGGLKVLPQRVERNEPLHALVDSTGMKIYGEGEWLDQKHGIRSPPVGASCIWRASLTPSHTAFSRNHLARYQEREWPNSHA